MCEQLKRPNYVQTSLKKNTLKSGFEVPTHVNRKVV